MREKVYLFTAQIWQELSGEFPSSSLKLKLICGEFIDTLTDCVCN